MWVNEIEWEGGYENILMLERETPDVAVKLLGEWERERKRERKVDWKKRKTDKFRIRVTKKGGEKANKLPGLRYIIQERVRGGGGLHWNRKCDNSKLACSMNYCESKMSPTFECMNKCVDYGGHIEGWVKAFGQLAKEHTCQTLWMNNQ